jgi:hypothetical protein
MAMTDNATDVTTETPINHDAEPTTAQSVNEASQGSGEAQESQATASPTAEAIAGSR